MPVAPPSARFCSPPEGSLVVAMTVLRSRSLPPMGVCLAVSNVEAAASGGKRRRLRDVPRGRANTMAKLGQGLVKNVDRPELTRSTDRPAAQSETMGTGRRVVTALWRPAGCRHPSIPLRGAAVLPRRGRRSINGPQPVHRLGCLRGTEADAAAVPLHDVTPRSAVTFFRSSSNRACSRGSAMADPGRAERWPARARAGDEPREFHESRTRATPARLSSVEPDDRSTGFAAEVWTDRRRENLSTAGGLSDARRTRPKWRRALAPKQRRGDQGHRHHRHRSRRRLGLAPLRAPRLAPSVRGARRHHRKIPQCAQG